MTKRSCLSGNLRCCFAATLLCFTVINIGPARAQNETSHTAAQLEQLVAPIALYPDALLSQVLMASTYPLEVVAAARWVQANPALTGKALEDAMQKQSWDPSVKALTAVPQTLQMMNDKLDWTRDLGDRVFGTAGGRARCRAAAAPARRQRWKLEDDRAAEGSQIFRASGRDAA